MIKKVKKKLKSHFKEVVEIKTSPESIAAGFALGTIIAILPTFGLGIGIGLGIIMVFKRVSKLSMMVAFALWNPFVLATLYPLEYAIGDFILAESPIIQFRIEIINQLFLYTRRYLVGSIILSLIVGTLSYFGVLLATREYQKDSTR